MPIAVPLVILGAAFGPHFLSGHQKDSCLERHFLLQGRPDQPTIYRARDEQFRCHGRIRSDEPIGTDAKLTRLFVVPATTHHDIGRYVAGKPDRVSPR